MRDWLSLACCRLIQERNIIVYIEGLEENIQKAYLLSCGGFIPPASVSLLAKPFFGTASDIHFTVKIYQNCEMCPYPIVPFTIS